MRYVVRPLNSDGLSVDRLLVEGNLFTIIFQSSAGLFPMLQFLTLCNQLEQVHLFLTNKGVRGVSEEETAHGSQLLVQEHLLVTIFIKHAPT